MPVSAAASITGSPCRVNGPAQAITTAASPISSRSRRGVVERDGSYGRGRRRRPAATASSFSLFLPASVTCGAAAGQLGARSACPV